MSDQKPVKKHPCLVQYGACQFGNKCKLAEFPGDTCLNYIRGRCTFKQACMYRHDVAPGGCASGPEKVVYGVGEVKMIGKSTKLGVIDQEYSMQPKQRPLIEEKTVQRKDVQVSIDYGAEDTERMVTMQAVPHAEDWMLEEQRRWEEEGECFEPKDVVMSTDEFPTLGSKKKQAAKSTTGLVVRTIAPETTEPEGMNPNAAPWQPSPWAGAARRPAKPSPKPTVTTVKAPKPKAKPALHPCAHQFGTCKYGSNCQYANLPGNTCLMYLQGQCKFGTACRNKHTRTPA